MKRQSLISLRLEVCESLFNRNPELFESWHGTFLRVARRDFDSSGELSDSAFTTLEKIHARVDPPKMGGFSAATKASLDGKLGKYTPQLYSD